MSVPKYGRGAVLWRRLPEADTDRQKHRPCVVVGDPIENLNRDYVVVEITTKLWRGPTDVAVESTDPSFASLGLRETSCIRCHKIFPVASSRIVSSCGSAPPELMKQVDDALRRALSL
ncbi:MAG: type II toxin-antitoxin system PemK/MazF family toxin [Pirellulales bacterium]